MPYDVDKKALKKIPARKQMEQHQWANDRLFDGVYYPVTYTHEDAVHRLRWEGGRLVAALSVDPEDAVARHDQNVVGRKIADDHVRFVRSVERFV